MLSFICSLCLHCSHQAWNKCANAQDTTDEALSTFSGHFDDFVPEAIPEVDNDEALDFHCELDDESINKSSLEVIIEPDANVTFSLSSNLCQLCGVFNNSTLHVCCDCSTSEKLTTFSDPKDSAMNAIPCNDNQTCTLIHDTGASHCSTGAKIDFVECEALPKSGKKTLDRITKGLPIEGIGIVEYNILTDANKNIAI